MSSKSEVVDEGVESKRKSQSSVGNRLGSIKYAENDERVGKDCLGGDDVNGEPGGQNSRSATTTKTKDSALERHHNLVEEATRQLRAAFMNMDKALDLIEKEIKYQAACTPQLIARKVATLEAGDSFGELALMSSSATRNACIMAGSEDVELIMIEKKLYDR